MHGQAALEKVLLCVTLLKRIHNRESFTSPRMHGALAERIY